MLATVQYYLSTDNINAHALAKAQGDSSALLYMRVHIRTTPLFVLLEFSVYFF